MATGTITASTAYANIERQVVTIVTNPTDPQWVHPGNVTHTSSNSVNAAGSSQANLTAGTHCHACTNKWNSIEIVLDGFNYYLSNAEQKTLILQDSEIKANGVTALSGNVK
jgi:hypothetical protein